MPEVTNLEQVLDNKGLASEEPVQVSEEPTEEEEVTEETEETKASFDVRVQAAADKRVKSYQEKREADTAFIRSLNDQLKEIKAEKRDKGIDKAMEAILAGDEEEGIEPDKIEERRKYLKEIKATIKEYGEKSAGVTEVASLANELASKIDKEISSNYNLFDSNPSVRAKGIMELMSDATDIVKEKQAFNKILEEIPLLQKGSEVRQQIDNFIGQYMELSDLKGKDLLIKQLKQEFKVTPSKKPQTPSDGGGGIDLSSLSSDEKIKRGLLISSKKK